MESSASSRRPSVLLVLTDDQGWGDVRSHGNERIDTPTLDRIADEGARFDRFFVSPLCAPTRAALLTGRYHLRTGVWGVTAGREVMRADETMIGKIFRDAGYATGCFGKWHSGEHAPHHPNWKGFDEFLGFCAGHWCNYFDPKLDHNGKEIQRDGYISDIFTDGAMDFIRQHRDEPFFCYLPFNAPHGPFQVPDYYFDKYKERGLDDRDACIYAMVDNVDVNVARLLDLLDELELADDTIVIFMTDNGPNGQRYNGDMRGVKGSVHEGGSRVPFFVRYPGKIREGLTVKPIAAHIDVLPTLADFCDVTIPRELDLDGMSLRPLLEETAVDWPERTLFTHRAAHDGKEAPGPAEGAVRSQQYRLVYEKSGYQLYDMYADPSETKEVSAEYPEAFEKLKTTYEQIFHDTTGGKSFERIPVPVGRDDAPEVFISAPLINERVNIEFIGGHGWAHDWLSDWTSTDGRASWKIDIVNEGDYAIVLDYICPVGEEGSQFRVTINDQSLDAQLTVPHDPAPVPVPDRIPRGEVVEKEWAKLEFPGTMHLQPGEATIDITATEIVAHEALQLRGVTIRRIGLKI